MAERYVMLMKSLRDLGLEITGLTESESGSWRMTLRGGQEIILGRKEQQKRLERFKVGYRQDLRARFADVRKIDLRYTNGFAVEWKQDKVAGRTGHSLGAAGAPESLGS
ncbi:MAG: cell division protein FtsQ/DivIB [Thiolinea sp.]